MTQSSILGNRENKDLEHHIAVLVREIIDMEKKWHADARASLETLESERIANESRLAQLTQNIRTLEDCGGVNQLPQRQKMAERRDTQVMTIRGWSPSRIKVKTLAQAEKKARKAHESAAALDALINEVTSVFSSPKGPPSNFGAGYFGGLRRYLQAKGFLVSQQTCPLPLSFLARIGWMEHLSWTTIPSPKKLTT